MLLSKLVCERTKEAPQDAKIKATFYCRERVLSSR